jgi:hypothetical protein
VLGYMAPGNLTYQYNGLSNLTPGTLCLVYVLAFTPSRDLRCYASILQSDLNIC